MNELKNLKNLLLDVLADEGTDTKINALQTLKIDQEINVPIIINQYQNININIRQNIVKAIQLIDEMDGNQLPVDLYSALHRHQFRLIDEAVRKTDGNVQAASKLLGIKRTTLVAMIDKREKGISRNNIISRHRGTSKREIKNNV